MVEFVSYTGEYPNLCRGILTLKIDGEIVEFPKNCMASGGSVWFDGDWGDHVESGAWYVDVPEEFLQYKQEIIDCVNENVPHGCCGGCV